MEPIIISTSTSLIRRILQNEENLVIAWIRKKAFSLLAMFHAPNISKYLYAGQMNVCFNPSANDSLMIHIKGFNGYKKLLEISKVEGSIIISSQNPTMEHSLYNPALAINQPTQIYLAPHKEFHIYVKQTIPEYLRSDITNLINDRINFQFDFRGLNIKIKKPNRNKSFNLSILEGVGCYFDNTKHHQSITAYASTKMSGTSSLSA